MDVKPTIKPITVYEVYGKRFDSFEDAQNYNYQLRIALFLEQDDDLCISPTSSLSMAQFLVKNKDKIIELLKQSGESQ